LNHNRPESGNPPDSIRPDSALMQGEGKYVVFHPTLASIFATPATAPARTSPT
jgi:hypothetical protein